MLCWIHDNALCGKTASPLPQVNRCSGQETRRIRTVLRDSVIVDPTKYIQMDSREQILSTPDSR